MCLKYSENVKWLFLRLWFVCPVYYTVCLFSMKDLSQQPSSKGCERKKKKAVMKYIASEFKCR